MRKLDASVSKWGRIPGNDCVKPVLSVANVTSAPLDVIGPVSKGTAESRVHAYIPMIPGEFEISRNHRLQSIPLTVRMIAKYVRSIGG